MKNIFNKLIATAAILVGFISTSSAQTKPQNPNTAKSTQAQTSKVSEAVKAQVNTKVSSGVVKSSEPFGKQPTEHSQSGGHSKFSKPVDKTSKVNVQKAAVKAIQTN